MPSPAGPAIEQPSPFITRTDVVRGANRRAVGVRPAVMRGASLWGQPAVFSSTHAETIDEAGDFMGSSRNKPFTLLILDEFAPQYGTHFSSQPARILTATTRSEAYEKISEADGLAAFGSQINEELLARGTKLRWIQALSSGVDLILRATSSRPELIITSAAGVHGAAVSEMVVLLMLAAARDLPRYLRQQGERVWARHPGSMIAAKTVGIVGMGVIGTAVARHCKAFGAEVVGFGSTVRHIEGVDRFHLYAELENHVHEIDYLIVAAPLREDTSGLIGRKVLEKAHPGAVLINVGRGNLIDHGALEAALSTGRLAGAALDAHTVEPLPKDSPIWSLPNVIITPHVSAYVDSYPNFVAPVIIRNLQAMMDGDYQRLVNCVTHEPT